MKIHWGTWFQLIWSISLMSLMLFFVIEIARGQMSAWWIPVDAYLIFSSIDNYQLYNRYHAIDHAHKKRNRI